ncbi:unnamed protein product [Diabrotica balteata]|uniref:G-protein coupled receptors family 1 profile domain-containing protein n=1 Tax=Diabrotica balteata TaxID=107213 RepID=A0A9N9XAS9_DIABA|nr:unnamed protein product [Diabrotica balteata]
MSVIGEPSYAGWAAQRAAGFGGNITVVDKVLPDMLHMVDAYWYQFPPMNPLWHGILGFMIGVLGFVSITGNGPFFCELYGMFGSLFGCASIWTMVFIALDRYNVIVKGLSAQPLTKKTAMLRILLIWAMSVGWTIAPLFGWNRYVPEGNMTACGTDYLNQDPLSKSYLYVYGVFVYFFPLFIIIYSYFFIVQAVAAHEKSMREQAKKMNVASLRSSEASQTSAECKLAKIALMTITLWFMAWTPYLVTNFAGIMGNSKISPLATIWCSLFAKANAVYNPIVYGISHPKYRQALEKKFPSLVCTQPQDDTVSTATGVSGGDEKPAA